MPNKVSQMDRIKSSTSNYDVSVLSGISLNDKTGKDSRFAMV